MVRPRMCSVSMNKTPNEETKMKQVSDNAIGYAKFHSRSHNAVIRVYDDAGNVIETQEHAGEFRE